jgi:phage host-nuclease inhibitor protein Gam
MSPAKREKRPAMTVVPKSREEASQMVAQIGSHQRQRERIQATMNDEIATLRARYEEKAQEHGRAIADLVVGLQAWAEANRVDLTEGGKTKTVTLASGEVRWRTNPPKVSVRGGLQAVIDSIKALGLAPQFVRFKEELNKEAMLAEPAVAQGIKGVRIEQSENFVVEPFELHLEEVV